MDNLPHYSANAINNSGQSYSGQRQLQPQPQPSGPQTLPPLQPNHQPHQVMQSQNSYQYGQSPRAPATGPGTPAPPSSVNTYAPPPQNPQTQPSRASYGMMNTSAYAPPPPPPTYTSSMMPQATTAPSGPQSIAPSPAQSARAAPVLRPMPQDGVMPAMNSPYAQGSMMLGGDQPTHVVGSQGRRGILPSAPGKPPSLGPGAAKAPIPQKDADGKFPCPHCTKTYLHAKHLKRHLLRHSGERPYMCVLCRDTFSRSDILKRHFIKCSVRRGNPTGASHLSHPQAHQRPKGAQAKAAGNEEGNMNGMGNMPGDPMGPTYGLLPASDGMNTVANEQNQLPRSGNVAARLDDPSRDRRSMSGSVMAASSRPGPYEGSYAASSAEVPTTVAPQMNPQMASYNMPQHQMFGGQANQSDWSQMFQPDRIQARA